MGKSPIGWTANTHSPEEEGQAMAGPVAPQPGRVLLLITLIIVSKAIILHHTPLTAQPASLQLLENSKQVPAIGSHCTLFSSNFSLNMSPSLSFRPQISLWGVFLDHPSTLFITILSDLLHFTCLFHPPALQLHGRRAGFGSQVYSRHSVFAE